MRELALAGLTALGMSMAPARAQTLPRADAQLRAPEVFAAGSLRAAMGELADAFARQGGARPRLSFGASGLLKDRIVAGERADVFASANMAHPQALVDTGRAHAVRVFARNRLCALASPSFSLRGQPLALRLLNADVRLGTSTPQADPSGDYAFEMFERIEARYAAPAGAAAALKAKALQLTGGSQSPPPADRSVYGMLVAGGQADVFITYCTNATQAQREQPALQVLPIPDAYNVGSDYGLAVLHGAAPSASDFADFVLSAPGQAILATHGFTHP